VCDITMQIAYFSA